MMRCPSSSAVNEWAQRGAGVELDPEIERHAQGCASCRASVSEVLELRRLGGSLPAHELDPERSSAIRFALMSEARQHAGRSAGRLAVRARFEFGRPLALAAAAAMLVVGLGALLVIRSQPSAQRNTPAQTHVTEKATVGLAPQASGSLLRSAPDEVYRLSNGSAEFSVRKLGAGERYRVLAGDATIEVRGTRFRVDVADQRLQRVQVSEGRVWVWLATHLVADLSAGESWGRSESANVVGTESTAPGAVGSRPSSVEVAPSLGTREAEAESPPLGAETAVRHRFTGRHPARNARRPKWSGAAPRGTPPLSEPSAAAAPAATGNSNDLAFAEAWRLLGQGQAAQAAGQLDALSGRADLDRERRADVLFWASQAYARAGRWAAAESRAQRLVGEYPSSFRVGEAALLLGNAARARGDRDQAKTWFERASASGPPGVRTRARAALEQLDAP